LARQLREPLEEADLIPAIRSLAPIADPVSLDVQRMYEEHPYPRWSSVRIKHRNMKKLNILVAGCGSGHQAILWAAQYPMAHVVGLDLSRVSLAYGLRKARELNIANLEFVHGDILDVSKFARSFDIISCFGVLHHMRDPAEGLRALRGALTDGGYIELGLYSEAGRQPVVHAIRLRGELGLLPTAEGIRNLRRHILALPPTHPAHEITRFFDFYTMSGCRDLLFHVQEHRFDLLGVARLLDETGFKLCDLRVGPAAVERFHRDVQGGDVTSLADWHKFEVKNPITFRKMYPIIIMKA
jgi:SAM-dependent methyltransferase